MARISNAKKGREDGGYTRVMGDKELGALLSRVQATLIAAGTELEKLVSSHAVTMTETELGQFLSGTLSNGTYLLTKKLIKKKLSPILKTKNEPDFLVIKVVDAKIFVIELKDGDSFDTKKSEGEVEHLREFISRLLRYMLGDGKSPAVLTVNGDSYVVELRICCFNQNDKDKIVEGFKKRISIKEAMTGEEFCKLIGIAYSTISTIRNVDQTENFKFFLDELVKIPTISAYLHKYCTCPVTPLAPVSANVDCVESLAPSPGADETRS